MLALLLPDLLRTIALSMGMLVVGGLILRFLVYMKAGRWDQALFRWVSIVGCSYILIEIRERLGEEDLTWRTPTALLIFACLVAAILIQRGNS